jgi:hypothetical protein
MFVSAEKLKPMKEAWKYRIRKFQNIVFLMSWKSFCTFGILFVRQIAAPIAITRSTIPIAAMATPSRLWKTAL